MAKAVIMPKFGFTQEVATIVRWLVKDGDLVEQGDPLAEVTTDKINMEVEAPTGGVVTGLKYPEGAEVPVTEVICTILAPEEQAPASVSPALSQPEAPTLSARTETKTQAPPKTPVTPVARRMAEIEGVNLGGLKGSGPQGRVTAKDVRSYLESQAIIPPGDQKVRATPAARRIAAEQQVDLRFIPGTGLKGRIQGADVQAYLATHEAALPAAAAPVAPVVAPQSAAAVQAPAPLVTGLIPQPVALPLEGMRRTIAQRMQASAQQAPHIYLTLDIDMGQAERMRAYLNTRLQPGQPQISMTAVIIKAVAAALVQHPQVNSYFQSDKVYLMPDVNVGMAVALEDGLIVPVIHKAGEKSLAQIGAEVADLSRRARDGQLKPEDVVDGTFTVSNLGMFGIDHFTAIINPPQVGILAIGRIARRFVPGEGDRPVAHSLMTVTMAVDHRVLDGAIAARFLNTLKGILETAGAQWG
jgi:pyruvate dehydrogenase E2 component (dihydrolipoamide acetyltransferase)